MKPQINKKYNEYKCPSNKTTATDTVLVTYVSPGTERFILNDVSVWFCRVKDSQDNERHAWIDGNDVIVTEPELGADNE